MNTPKATIIKPGNGHPPVHCYGEWLEDSNCSAVFEDEWLDGIWADGAKNWTEAVKELAAHAQRHNSVLLECVTC